MTDRAVLIREIDSLPPDYWDEVLDMVKRLKQNAAEPTPEKLAAADAALTAGEPCPLCEKHRDSVSGELRFNAETIAAFEEGDAMERGEIPANRYHSVAEIWEELGL
jgi:hypothetical protein